MKRPSPRQWLIVDPLARSLWIATVCIMGAFAVVSVVSEVHLRRLDRTARELAAEVAPKVECLAEARGQLQELHRALRVGSGGARQQRQKVGEELSHCGVELPQLQRWLVSDARYDAAPSGAPLRSLFAQADEALERAVLAQAQRSAEIGRAIGLERSRARRASIAVHSLAAFVALLAVGIVWLTSHQRAQFEARQRKLVTERARELELFASRAAHDLKSPLSSVLLYLRAAGTRQLTSETARVIEETVAGAVQIVDALLDYACAGREPTPDARAIVDESVAHVLRSLWPRGSEGDTTVSVDVEPGLVVRCPPGGVASIVGNLVRNAFDHGVARGASRVVVRAFRAGERARLEVIDDGPGVAESLQRSIFQPYVRGETKGRAGLGLGLATVSRFAVGCGGAVGHHAPPEGGSCFWVELPLGHEGVDELDRSVDHDCE